MAAHREADRTPAQADGNDAVAGRIADAVDGLAELWTAAAAEASVRLSPHQLRALHALEAEPGANLTLLAERLEAGLPTVSRLCDRLEAAGLLLRRPRRTTAGRYSSGSPRTAGTCSRRWPSCGPGR